MFTKLCSHPLYCSLRQTKSWETLMLNPFLLGKYGIAYPRQIHRQNIYIHGTSLMHTNRYTMAKNVFYIFAQMYTSYLQQSISRCLKGQNDEKKWIFCQCGPQKTKKNKKTVILFQIFINLFSKLYCCLSILL